MIAIEHVGSTAVPGLVARPIIDILIGVRSLPITVRTIEVVCAIGYVHKGDADVPGRHYFSRLDTHVHVVEHGGTVWFDYLGFRDQLRAKPALVAEYTKLKLDLASKLSREDYTVAKTPFIETALTNARSPSMSI